jgi:hypothetical protein
MSTYKDFDSRELFVKSLNLFHYDKSSTKKEFRVLHNFTPDFDSELSEIKQNLNEIKTTWHNQSVEQIEKSVTKQGEQQLRIMSGQKNDKLQAGYMPDAPMYRIKTCAKDSVFYKLADILGLEHAYARYHVQFPGEVTAWHTDIFSPAHEFLPDSTKNFSENQVGKDQGIRRVLVALEDWDWGQSVMFGSDIWKQWGAGDIVSWNYGTPHCSANMGFTARISVSITGLATTRYHGLTHSSPLSDSVPDRCYLDQFNFLTELNRRIMVKMEEIKSQNQNTQHRLENLLRVNSHAITRLSQLYNTNDAGISGARKFYIQIINEL